MRKLTFIITILTLSVILLSGCRTTMVPIETHHHDEKLAVDLIVGQEYPRFHRDDPFTPIHVTIRNNTSKIVQLKYQHFALFDPKGRKFVLAPVKEVVDWLNYGRWDPYYSPFFPRPVGNYVFREGKLDPGREIQRVMFFHQATRFGQGAYKLVATIPGNGRTLEYKFRLD